MQQVPAMGCVSSCFFVILIDDGSAYIAVTLACKALRFATCALTDLPSPGSGIRYIRAACMLGQRPTAAAYDVNSAPWLSLSLLTRCPYCAAVPRCTVCLEGSACSGTRTPVLCLCSQHSALCECVEAVRLVASVEESYKGLKGQHLSTHLLWSLQ